MELVVDRELLVGLVERVAVTKVVTVNTVSVVSHGVDASPVANSKRGTARKQEILILAKMKS